MNSFIQDLRHGLRQLARSPAFSATVVLIAALGIGATTAIFTVVQHVLLRGLPYPDAGRITMLWDDDGGRTDPTPTPGRHQHPVSYLDFRDWQQQSRGFSAIAAYWQERGNLSGDADPEEINQTTVTAGFFSVMGINPAHGRALRPEEDELGQAKVAVLSDALWQRRFGGDASVVGRTVRLNDEAVTVVGIMPPGFGFPETGSRQTDLWIPLNLTADYREHRDWSCCKIIARLAPGVSLEQAQAGMDLINDGLVRQFPDIRTGWSIYLVPLHEQTVGRVRPALMVLAGVVGFVLLIVCANVASLLMVRAGGREREFAIRAALGAGRGPIVRQLLTESSLLASLGGLVGLALAWAGVKALVYLSPEGLPRLGEIRVDGLALVFSIGVALLTGLLFGLMPAWHAAAPDLQQVLKAGGRNISASRRTRRIGSVLLIGEVALSLIALTGAGLLIRSLTRLQQVETGFRVDNVVTMPLTVSLTQYPGPANVSGLIERLIARVGAVPGVRSAAAGSPRLLESRALRDRIEIEGRPALEDDSKRTVTFDVVSPGYFGTLDIPLRAGRFFGPQDDAAGPPVVIINETLQRSYWGDASPLGKRIKYSTDDRWFTVVGVVADTRRAGLDIPVGPATYWPIAQDPLEGGFTLVVQAVADPLPLAPAIREAIWSVDRQLPADNFQTVAQLVDRSLAQRRFTMLLLTVLAAIALVLAAAGIYGVISYGVSQRTQEIGIRRAVGAQVGDVLALILKEGMGPVLIGEVAGLAGALLLTRLMAGLLVGVSATDPRTFSTIVLIMTAVALAACWAPARRATKVDPIVSLRHD